MAIPTHWIRLAAEMLDESHPNPSLFFNWVPCVDWTDEQVDELRERVLGILNESLAPENAYRPDTVLKRWMVTAFLSGLLHSEAKVLEETTQVSL